MVFGPEVSVPGRTENFFCFDVSGISPTGIQWVVNDTVIQSDPENQLTLNLTLDYNMTTIRCRANSMESAPHHIYLQG